MSNSSNNSLSDFCSEKVTVLAITHSKPNQGLTPKELKGTGNKVTTDYLIPTTLYA